MNNYWTYPVQAAIQHKTQEAELLLINYNIHIKCTMPH